jgi:hypothetical protein
MDKSSSFEQPESVSMKNRKTCKFERTVDTMSSFSQSFKKHCSSFYRSSVHKVSNSANALRHWGFGSIFSDDDDDDVSPDDELHAYLQKHLVS